MSADITQAADTGMVERVARALFAYDIEHHSMQITGGRRWEDHSRRHAAYRALARAAIEAMREPGEEMTLAAEALDKFYPFSSERSEVAEDEAKWRAMIDAALGKPL